MKPSLSLLGISLLLLAPHGTAENAKLSNTVILDDTGVKNLHLQTVVAEVGDFEETIFALGRIEVYPGRRAAVSSRIAGRALAVNVKHDHFIEKGDVAVIVESRQIGDPPPRIAVTAPISGLVSATYIVPGEPVSPDKILADIIDLSEVYALASVPEHLAGQLKSGQSARITVAAASGEVFTAELEHLGALADADHGVVEAAFHVNNPEFRLRPGMRAEFSIVTSKRSGVVRIPRSALQGDPAHRFVYVKDFDLPYAFVKTPVVIGRINDRHVEIVSGLLPADEVVTRGAYSLAFAGKGSLSLKEALDAAHGHEHNADGSEITADQKNAVHAGHSGDAHHHGNESLFWKITSGVLFVALIIVAFGRKTAARVAD
jgi:membrane fusion protein, heavy metal efflux system